MWSAVEGSEEKLDQITPTDQITPDITESLCECGKNNGEMVIENSKIKLELITLKDNYARLCNSIEIMKKELYDKSKIADTKVSEALEQYRVPKEENETLKEDIGNP